MYDGLFSDFLIVQVGFDMSTTAINKRYFLVCDQSNGSFLQAMQELSVINVNTKYFISVDNIFAD